MKLKSDSYTELFTISLFDFYLSPFYFKTEKTYSESGSFSGKVVADCHLAV